jgi:hypothetical protein
MLPMMLGPASFFHTRRFLITTGQKPTVTCGAV